MKSYHIWRNHVAISTAWLLSFYPRQTTSRQPLVVVKPMFAVSLANYGLDAAFVTKLPAHDIGQCAVNDLKKIWCRYINDHAWWRSCWYLLFGERC